MRMALIFLWSFTGLTAAAQPLQLTSLQHELRWLEEYRFPPFVKNRDIAGTLLQHTASVLAAKFQAAEYSQPSQIDYRLISMFGKPKLKSPKSGAGYQAAVLSFLTRGTTNTDVFWSFQVEVKQNGKTIYRKETEHQLLYYGPEERWFTAEEFITHYKNLFDELLELSPPRAYKYIVGDGMDYAEILKNNSEPWEVEKKSNPLGFGLPSFGAYHTIDAGKLDTAVFRTKTVVDKETSFSSRENFNDGGKNSLFVFNQYKVVDFSKTIFCQLLLGSGADTTEAVFSVGVLQRETRRTVLGVLFGEKSDNSMSSPIEYRRDIAGRLVTGPVSWDFVIENYDADGAFSHGYLVQQQEEYLLEYQPGKGASREVILKKGNGEYVAALYPGMSPAVLRVHKGLDPAAERAIAAFYAVLLSAKNVK